MKLYPLLKTAGKSSISASLSISLVLSPLLAYGDPNTNSAQVQNAPAVEQPQVRPDDPIRRALEMAITGTAKTSRESFDVAMAYLDAADKKNAEKFLLNGASATALAGLLNPTLTRRLSDAGNHSHNTWLDASITTSNIENAINQAKQQAAIPNSTFPMDFPGAVGLPTPTNLNPVNPLGAVSSDEQIRRLMDLMNSNPELRTLLWQTAEERLQTNSFIGANPPAYLPAGVNPNGWQSVCPQGSMLCSIYAVFNAGGTDYATPMAMLKNEFYGFPLDGLAQRVIHERLLMTELAAFSGSFLKAFPTIRSMSSQTYWGQVIPDWGANGVLYFVLYSMIGRMAALYNYPLAQDEQMAIFLFLVAATGAALPMAMATKGQGLDPSMGGQPASELSLAKFGGKTLARAHMTKTSFYNLVEKILAKHPKLAAKMEAGINYFKRAKSTVVAEEKEEIAKLKRLRDEAEGKTTADPIAVDPIVKTSPLVRFTKNALGDIIPSPFPVPGPGPLPGPVPPVPNPTNPKPKGGFARQIAAMTVKGFGRAFAYREFAILVGVIANGFFRNYYIEHRRMQNEKFRAYMMGGKNKAFLKLLVLSQNPSKLVLKPVPTIPTPPTTPINPVFPPTPVLTPTTPGKADPNAPFFPFAALSSPIIQPPLEDKINATGFGGHPAQFIMNFARSLHVCSVQDINSANQKVPAIKELLNSKPSLAKLNEFDDSPDEYSYKKEFLYQNMKDIEGLFTNKVMENVAQAISEGELSPQQAKDILLVHDCRGRMNADVYNDLVKDMVSFASFSDADISSLRSADAFTRLRMGELIEQVLYLNGPPRDNVSAYTQNVQKILAIDGDAFINYFNYYESKLADSYFVADPFSQTGFRLEGKKSLAKRPESLKSANPYDLTIMDEWRPDEPQALHPIPKPITNGTNGVSNFPSGGGIFTPGGGGLGSGNFPFTASSVPYQR